MSIKKRIIEQANKNLETRYLNEKWYHNAALAAGMLGATMGGNVNAQSQDSLTKDKQVKSVEYVDKTKVSNWNELQSLVPTHSCAYIQELLNTDTKTPMKPLMRWKTNRLNTANNEDNSKTGQVLSVELSNDTMNIEILFEIDNSAGVQGENLNKVRALLDSIKGSNNKPIRNIQFEKASGSDNAGAIIPLNDLNTASKVINQILQLIELTGTKASPSK